MLSPIAYIPQTEYCADIGRLQRINRQISVLNKWIERYNELSATPDEQSEVLAILYVLQKHYDDSNLAMLSFSRMRAESQQYVELFHNRFIPSMKEAFRARGVEPFSDSAVIQWDCVTNSKKMPLPSQQQFYEAAGRPDDGAVLEILTAVKRCSDKSLEPVARYNTLLNLKDSLHLVFATNQASPRETKAMHQLLLAVNYQIQTMLIDYPELESIYSRRPALATELESMPLNILIETLVGPLQERKKSILESENPFTNYWRERGYEMAYLGEGLGNAHNILLTHGETQKQLILKVCPRMGNTTRCADRLRKTELHDSLVDVYCSRPTSVLDDSGQLMEVQLVEFCPGGDLVSHRKKLQTPDEVATQAIQLCKQMADILNKFTRQGALFADMKPANFLVNDGKLMIADVKSFLDTPTRTFSQAKLADDENYSFTTGFSLPEIKLRKDVSQTDKHHAYLMGISLYLFITNKDILDIAPAPLTVPNPELVTFESEVFRTPQGAQLQQLIKDLMNPDPNERLGLLAAQRKLQEMSPEIYIYSGSSSLPTLFGQTSPESAASVSSASSTSLYSPASSSSSSSGQAAQSSPVVSASFGITSQFRMLAMFRRFLNECYGESRSFGRCPRHIDKCMGAPSLKAIGDIASAVVSKGKPFSRSVHLHQLYGILARLADPRQDPKEILQAAKEHWKSAQPVHDDISSLKLR